MPTGREFGSVAAAYHERRPRYPTRIVRTLMHAASLRPGDYVADLGAGTGILTKALLDQGLRVDAVEPDRQMVQVMRSELTEHIEAWRLRVFPVSFEEAIDGGHLRLGYAAVTAGTSWRWLGSPERRNRGANFILRPEGVLAILQNTTAVAGPGADFHAAAHQIYVEHLGEGLEPNPLPALADLPPDEYDPELFAFAAHASEVTHTQRTAEEYTGLVSTYSPVARLDPEARGRLVGALTTLINEPPFNGYMIDSLATTLTVATSI
jgi:SAM-dependent methyltransferase